MMPPFLPRKVMNFVPTDYRQCTPTLSAFPGDRLSSVLVNSATECMSTFIRVSLPGWCHPGRPPSPVMPLNRATAPRFKLLQIAVSAPDIWYKHSR